MFKKMVTVPVTQNFIHVQVRLKDGSQKVVVFYDQLLLDKGEFSIQMTAQSLFSATKNKDPRIQRVWATPERTDWISESEIVGFGEIEKFTRVNNYLMKQNVFTKKLSWS